MCIRDRSGTLHAICRGIVIAEIQQSSNVTYRVYDLSLIHIWYRGRLHLQVLLLPRRRAGLDPDAVRRAGRKPALLLSLIHI